MVQLQIFPMRPNEIVSPGAHKTANYFPLLNSVISNTCLTKSQRVAEHCIGSFLLTEAQNHFFKMRKLLFLTLCPRPPTISSRHTPWHAWQPPMIANSKYFFTIYICAVQICSMFLHLTHSLLQKSCLLTRFKQFLIRHQEDRKQSISFAYISQRHGITFSQVYLGDDLRKRQVREKRDKDDSPIISRDTTSDHTVILRGTADTQCRTRLNVITPTGGSAGQSHTNCLMPSAAPRITESLRSLPKSLGTVDSMAKECPGQRKTRAALETLQL